MTSLLPAGVTVLERGWLSSNNVVVRGLSEAAVVDTGYWTHSEQTLELVARAAEGVPLRTLVSTHLHSDHCGGNAALQASSPTIRTLVPPGLAQAVRDWDPVALTYEPTGQYCPPFRLDATLCPGEEIRLGDLAWEVHAAPGHDAHSVILFEPRSRTLISADALWQNGFGVVFQELEGERAFDEVAATLDRIELLRPALVIPGHGPLFTDVADALTRARSRLAAYRANPARHAVHAAKVLLKFKLLELQRAPRAELMAWAERTAYFEIVRKRWFPAEAPADWVASLVAELAASGAAVLAGEEIRNA